MTTNPELLYALLSMDAYHRGNPGGINEFMIARGTQIDATTRLQPNPNNPFGFSAQTYSYNGGLVIAYRGTDDGSAAFSFAS